MDQCLRAKKMKMHNSFHDDMCPRCGNEVEDQMHVLRCECNTRKKGFLKKMKSENKDGIILRYFWGKIRSVFDFFSNHPLCTY